MQSTFLNAFRGVKRGVVPKLEAAWLFKIAHNVCLSRRRSAWRRGRIESPADFEVIEEVTPAPSRGADELIGLQEVLQGMPETQRRAILLREWQGLSYREIAEELELSQAAVETLIFRARRSLASGLEQPPESKRAPCRARTRLGQCVRGPQGRAHRRQRGCQGRCDRRGRDRDNGRRDRAAAAPTASRGKRRSQGPRPRACDCTCHRSRPPEARERGARGACRTSCAAGAHAATRFPPAPRGTRRSRRGCCGGECARVARLRAACFRACGERPLEDRRAPGRPPGRPPAQRPQGRTHDERGADGRAAAAAAAASDSSEQSAPTNDGSTQNSNGNGGDHRSGDHGNGTSKDNGGGKD